jgi:diguanylate cyclase (GGDEF)-like protein
MSGENIRIRIENEIFGRMEKKYSEEEQANHLMSLLMDNYPLMSAVTISADSQGENLSVFAHRGLSGNFIKEMYAKKTLPVVVEALKDPVSISGDDDRAKDPSFRLEHGYKCLFAAPCRLQGETLGVFLVDSGDPGLLTKETQESFLAYTRFVTIFLALRTLRGKISRVPDVDSVTGLFTFKIFHEVLHRELTRGMKFQHPVSLMFLKVRNLRELNAVYGHVAADAALAEAVRLLRSNLRDVDHAARSGGDIYVVMPRMEKNEAAKTAALVTNAMNASPVGKGEIHLKFAVGVTAYPKDGDTERILIPHTEAMVHESIRKGGNAFSIYPD